MTSSSQYPRISIVVPSYNQGHFLRETLQSLVDQDYPNLQVVIQDGLSKDNSVEVAREFVSAHPDVFSLFSEKDEGQADAINRGFARVDGTILGFLNSDDTLYPGTLHTVAREIDPTKNRCVVMGRCMFTGENSRYVGVEHPAEYVSHFEHLAIWKRGFNTIPQPSVFWHRSVTDQVGLLDPTEHHALDYDLFSRMSRYHHFHKIDQLFSTYRMHDESKSSQRTEKEVLDLTIGVSRKHWGQIYSPLRWRLAASHAAYAHQFHDNARHHARKAEKAFHERALFPAISHTARAFMYSPRMAWDRLILGFARSRKYRFLEKFVERDDRFFGRHADGWIGPHFRSTSRVPGDASDLLVVAEFSPQPGMASLEATFSASNGWTETHRFDGAGPHGFNCDVSGLRGQDVTFEIVSSDFFVPSEVTEFADDRELSLRIVDVSYK